MMGTHHPSSHVHSALHDQTSAVHSAEITLPPVTSTCEQLPWSVQQSLPEPWPAARPERRQPSGLWPEPR